MKDLWKEIADFLKSLEAKGYSENTLKVYRSDLKRFRKFLEGQDFKGWVDVTRSELVSYAQSLLLPQGKKKIFWSAATRNRHLTTLRSLFRYLVKVGVVLSNPASELEGFRSQMKLPRVPTHQEVLKFLASFDVSTPLGLRDRCIMEMFYSCGPRLSELLNLDLQDLCFSKKTLHIRQGKYGRDRLLPMLSEVEKLLLEYLERSRPKLKGESPALFLSSLGQRLSPQALSETFQRHNHKAKVPVKVTAHTLRHCCATHLLKEKVSLRHIQVLLGHQNLSTTQVYTKVEISDLQKIVREHHPRQHFGEGKEA